jgi:hypothetical protein
MSEIYTYMTNFTKGWLKYQNSYEDLTKADFYMNFRFTECDLWGLAPVQTINGTQNVITFTDNKSCLVWVSFLKHKSDAFAAFKE